MWHTVKQIISSQHQPLCWSSKDNIWKDDTVKVICSAFMQIHDKHKWNESSVPGQSGRWSANSGGFLWKPLGGPPLPNVATSVKQRWSFKEIPFCFKNRTVNRHIEGWPGPLYDRLWRCWPSAAAWRWGVWQEAGGGSPLKHEAVPVEFVSAAGQPPLNSAPYIFSHYSCSCKHNYTVIITLYLKQVWQIQRVLKHATVTGTNLEDSDNLSIKSPSVWLTFSGAWSWAITQSCSLVIRSSNDNIVLLTLYRAVTLSDTLAARSQTGHVI